MTRDEVLALPAGRELDALVAEKVMGFAWYSLGFTYPHDLLSWPDDRRLHALQRVNGEIGLCCGSCNDHKELPRYSTDIAAAWEVVEKLKMTVGRYDYDDVDEPAPWGATVRDIGGLETYGYDATADTAPLAICRAALLCVTEG